jgi:hypothetical protein
MNGAPMIAEGAGYRIAPASEAAGGGYGALIIPVGFVKAATIARFITPYHSMPKYNSAYQCAYYLRLQFEEGIIIL